MSFEKKSYPLIDVRRHLETGPIVLVTSHWDERRNVMALGWHTMLQFSPALFGCYIWEGNHSFDLIRTSRECVVNIPTEALIEPTVEIGNRHAVEGDKLLATGLTAEAASQVSAPMIAECYASFECRVYDDRMIDDFGFFIFEIVAAHVADVEAPRTIHYRGDGTFMIAGSERHFRHRFRPENL